MANDIFEEDESVFDVSQELDNLPKLKGRIIWHSVAPWIKSGYGNLSLNILYRMKKIGLEPYCSCYYGAESGGILDYKGIKCFGSKEGNFGIISVQKLYMKLHPDLTFLSTDWWAFPDFSSIPFSILYGPMDMFNYFAESLKFTNNYWKIIPICEFQKKVLATDFKYKSEEVVPHGVNTKIFKPLDKSIKIENGLGDKFVIGTVNANADKEGYGGRKGWAQMMKAVALFLEDYPQERKNVVWLAHTNPVDGRGYNLVGLSKKFNLQDVIKFPNPTLVEDGISWERLAELYNCFDVFLACSKREGFGLTILEAESCGVPVITHDSTSMTELVKGHGWLVRSVTKDLNIETTNLLGDNEIPDVYSIKDALEEAYFSPTKRKEFGIKSREFALQYDWDYIFLNKWYKVLERILEEREKYKIKLWRNE